MSGPTTNDRLRELATRCLFGSTPTPTQMEKLFEEFPNTEPAEKFDRVLSALREAHRLGHEEGTEAAAAIADTWHIKRGGFGSLAAAIRACGKGA